MGRPEKETPIDVEKRSKRKTRGSTVADANVEEEGLPKKKGKLSHRIRRKRRTGIHSLYMNWTSSMSVMIP